jgi:hypothetical protein
MTEIRLKKYLAVTETPREAQIIGDLIVTLNPRETCQNFRGLTLDGLCDLIDKLSFRLAAREMGC